MISLQRIFHNMMKRKVENMGSGMGNILVSPMIRNLIVLQIAFTPLLAISAELSERLEDVHQWVVDDFSNVVHISKDQMSEIESEKLVIVDVREPEEFEVSRIQGAIRVSPNADLQEVLREIGSVQGQSILFYCSVGRRSSELADKIQKDLYLKGASRVMNLKGGIFNWHDQSSELYNDLGKTDFVHPYDGKWKRYLKRQAQARYE